MTGSTQDGSGRPGWVGPRVQAPRRGGAWTGGGARCGSDLHLWHLLDGDGARMAVAPQEEVSRKVLGWCPVLVA